jgi:hypothetical protein
LISDVPGELPGADVRSEVSKSLDSKAPYLESNNKTDREKGTVVVTSIAKSPGLMEFHLLNHELQ